MANANWIKGGSSPNPHGRPKKKRSSPTIARLIESFVKRNASPRKLQAMFDKLDARDRMSFLVDLLPYAVAKKPTATAISFGQLSDEQIDELYNQVLTNAALVPDDDESGVIPFTEIKTLGNGTGG